MDDDLPTSSHDLKGTLRSEFRSVAAEFATLARAARRGVAAEVRTAAAAVRNPATRTDTLKAITRALVRYNACMLAILAVVMPIAGVATGVHQFVVGTGLAMLLIEVAWAGRWFPARAETTMEADTNTGVQADTGADGPVV